VFHSEYVGQMPMGKTKAKVLQSRNMVVAMKLSIWQLHIDITLKRHYPIMWRLEESAIDRIPSTIPI